MLSRRGPTSLPRPFTAGILYSTKELASAPQRRSLALRAAALMDDHWVDVGLIVWPTLLSLSTFLVSSDALGIIEEWGGAKRVWRTAAILGISVSLVMYVATALASMRRSKRVSALEARVTELEQALHSISKDIFGFAEDLLKQLAGALDFGRNGNSERITIYAHDGGRLFTSFGRFSENPQFRKRSRRAQYVEDQGCIGKAWQEGLYFRCDYPDPQADLEGWIHRCVADGMDEATARNMNMKSRLYFGYRVDSRDHEPMAVVIVESTDPGRYTDMQLRDFFGDWGTALEERLERFRSSLPRAADAREAGF